MCAVSIDLPILTSCMPCACCSLDLVMLGVGLCTVCMSACSNL